MSRNRLEAFSDGVIAIIITIMVLDLKAPAEPTLAGILKVLPVFFSYALSFFLVAVYWVNHHHLVHLVKKVDGCMLWANMNLLFWMSFMPWAANWLGTSHAAPLAVQCYCLLAIVSAASFFILRQSIARHNLKDESLADLNRQMIRKNLIGLLIYLTALGAAFVSVPVALVLVAAPALMYFVPVREAEKIATD